MSYIVSDDYLNYLIKNCGVRGYDLAQEPHHILPDVAVALNYAKSLDISPYDELLEVGCGLGRILKELHDTFHIKPHGIDAVEKVICEAETRVGSLCKTIKFSTAENIDFPDQFFDKILCWGVFDLTNQTRALKEMTRVLKHNGLLLITGKTNWYEEDDFEAIAAEKASAQKGIPNHYTNIPALHLWAQMLGLTVSDYWSFRRRGDLSQNHLCDPLAVRFYEYIFLFRREHLVKLDALEGPVVGEKISDTLKAL
jgi:ubiquinone/menaquinone biosynthesis C-methylase UbiE